MGDMAKDDQDPCRAVWVSYSEPRTLPRQYHVPSCAAAPLHTLAQLHCPSHQSKAATATYVIIIHLHLFLGPFIPSYLFVAIMNKLNILMCMYNSFLNCSIDVPCFLIGGTVSNVIG
jgi:hypothetical protein